MKYKGKIEKIKHLVVTDPTYNENVWCRYENKNIDCENSDITIYIDKIKTDIEDCEIETIDFSLLISIGNEECSITKNGCLKHLENTKLIKYNIGVDSACIAFGINEYANKIISSKDEWQPDCAIRTGADGLFGTVIEGKNENGLNFIYIEGYFDSDLITTNELLNYFKENFNIKKLTVENEFVDKSTESMWLEV